MRRKMGKHGTEVSNSEPYKTRIKDAKILYKKLDLGPRHREHKTGGELRVKLYSRIEAQKHRKCSYQVWNALNRL